MAPQERWETFEEDEAECLSLSDFPVLVDKPFDTADESKSSGGDVDDEEFEFGISLEPDMCVADEVFFHGRILPLRRTSAACFPDGVPFPAAGSPVGSRSDSWDRFSSRSNSSGSSSCSSSSEQRCRLPARRSNNFYTHPSPTPRVLSARKSPVSRAPAAAAAGWGIFRLGVTKAPDMEPYTARSPRGGSVSSRMSNPAVAAKRAEEEEEEEEAVRGGGGGVKCYPPTVRGGGAAKGQRKAVIGGDRFSCKCSADAVEPIAVTKATIRRR